MKKYIRTQHILNASVEKVWSLIKTGADWEDWFPILKDSRVEGNMRFCDLENGDTLEEAFLTSNAEKTFIYTIHKQASFPANNIVGIIRLEEKNANSTKLYWSVEMDLESNEIFNELKQNIEGMYTDASKKLQELAA